MTWFMIAAFLDILDNPNCLCAQPAGKSSSATLDLMPIKSCLYGLWWISLDSKGMTVPVAVELTVLFFFFLEFGEGVKRRMWVVWNDKGLDFWFAFLHSFIISPWSCCIREFPVTVSPMCETEVVEQPGTAFAPFFLSPHRCRETHA